MTIDALQNAPLALDADPKRAAILAASMEVCARYGFRKASMEDIARMAGMSRPALYQYYPNKEAIFRAGVEAMFRGKIAGLTLSLQAPGDPTEVLTAAVLKDLGAMMQGVLNSPHGEEILHASKSVAQDVIEACSAEIIDLLAAFFARHGAADPRGLAVTFDVAKVGLAEGVESYEAYQDRLRHLSRAFGALLTLEGGQPPVA